MTLWITNHIDLLFLQKPETKNCVFSSIYPDLLRTYRAPRHSTAEIRGFVFIIHIPAVVWVSFSTFMNDEAISKLPKTDTPAEAGAQKRWKILDSGFRRSDADRLLKLPQTNQ
jgi:hypothetical protein